MHLCTIPRQKTVASRLWSCLVSCLQAAAAALHMFLNSGQGERCRQHPPVDFWAGHVFMLHVPTMPGHVSHSMLPSSGRVVMHTAFICWQLACMRKQISCLTGRCCASPHPIFKCADCAPSTPLPVDGALLCSMRGCISSVRARGALSIYTAAAPCSLHCSLPPVCARGHLRPVPGQGPAAHQEEVRHTSGAVGCMLVHTGSRGVRLDTWGQPSSPERGETASGGHSCML